MLTTSKTLKRQDITYVSAAPRRRALQLSLLLNEGLVFRPASLDLTALDPKDHRAEDPADAVAHDRLLR